MQGSIQEKNDRAEGGGMTLDFVASTIHKCYILNSNIFIDKDEVMIIPNLISMCALNLHKQELARTEELGPASCFLMAQALCTLTNEG